MQAGLSVMRFKVHKKRFYYDCEESENALKLKKYFVYDQARKPH